VGLGRGTERWATWSTPFGSYRTFSLTFILQKRFLRAVPEVGRLVRFGATSLRLDRHAAKIVSQRAGGSGSVVVVVESCEALAAFLRLD
jgi:hypothetical protein